MDITEVFKKVNLEVQHHLNREGQLMSRRLVGLSYKMQ